MKKSLFLGLIAISSFNVQADICTGDKIISPYMSIYYEDSERALTPEQCATVATGSSIAIASGINLAKIYRQAKKAKELEEKYTKTLFSQEPGMLSSEKGQKIIQEVVDGDKVTISYQLSEARNRLYHIELMESKEVAARKQAEIYRKDASSLLKMNANREAVPDEEGRKRYALLAMEEEEKANNYKKEATAAKGSSSAKIPTYTVSKVIDDIDGTYNQTQDFIDESIRQNNKITSIKRLPVKKHNFIKSISNFGLLEQKKFISALGIVAGAGFTMEEILSGEIAEVIDNNDLPFRIDLEE